jgi:hypothetical protein
VVFTYLIKQNYNSYKHNNTNKATKKNDILDFKSFEKNAYNLINSESSLNVCTIIHRFEVSM